MSRLNRTLALLSTTFFLALPGPVANGSEEPETGPLEAISETAHGGEISGDLCGDFEVTFDEVRLRDKEGAELDALVSLVTEDGSSCPAPPPGTGRCGNKTVDVPVMGEGVCYDPGEALGAIVSLHEAKQRYETDGRLFCFDHCLLAFSCPSENQFCHSAGVSISSASCVSGPCSSDPAKKSVICSATLQICGCRCANVN